MPSVVEASEAENGGAPGVEAAGDDALVEGHGRFLCGGGVGGGLEEGIMRARGGGRRCFL